MHEDTERIKDMKKTYVKPVAANVVFTMNENIAASFSSGHLGYISDQSFMGGSCNQYLAHTGIESRIVGEITDTGELITSVIAIREAIGNDAFEAVIAEIEATGAWSCWRK
jgi:hydroxyethylthiazole kinase-like sugar kinase family protein